MTTRKLKEMIRNGPYAWPGGYPLYFVTTDAAALCYTCVRKEYRLIYPSVRDGLDDGWAVEGREINWEDTDLYCDNCGEKIECAYEA